jgi:mono/diheme cytochrome c family protein
MVGCSKETPQKEEPSPATPASQPSTVPPERAGQGESLFKQHCVICHPGGGNIVKKEKTIGAKALSARNITRAEDIVKVMRNPGPGMNRFDEKIIPDADALAIGEYILSTFK